jgi:hypothetical protein
MSAEQKGERVMNAKLFAALGFAAVVAAGTCWAGPAGDYTHEVRRLGNKVAVDVFVPREPTYALTGRMPLKEMPAGAWTRETRTLGNKVTVEVYRR